jgi:uncharacterized membrane protein
VILASAFNDFFGKRGTRYDKSIVPDLTERVSAVLAMVLFAVAMLAVFKGRAQWAILPWQLWVHLSSLAVVLAITPLMLLRKRGDKNHRLLGWIWAICMFATALISLDIRMINDGSLSFIHILSVITIIGVPVLILSARRRDIGRHRGQARGFVIGALLIAGFFTFPFNRLLGSWLFN